MTPAAVIGDATLYCGDTVEVMRSLPAESVQCVVTSPPYWGLRDYGVPPTSWPEVEYRHLGTFPTVVVPSMECCLGLEKTPLEFVGHLVHVFREVWRVLRKDGTCWLNLGDSYATTPGRNNGNLAEWAKVNARGGGHRAGDKDTPSRKTAAGMKQKDLVGIPWMAAFALRADGWYLRSDVIWAKPNPMPESATDRPTRSHEYLFLLTKKAKYFYDAFAIREKATADHKQQRLTQIAEQPKGKKRAEGNGHNPTCQGGTGDARNKRSVWTVPTYAFPEAHFATFPPKLIEPCIEAGTSSHGNCPACGASWERILKLNKQGRDWRNDTMKAKGIPGELNGAGSYKRGQSASPLNDINTYTTTGWRQTCKCPPAPPVPAVVLDPFAGSGTVPAVALRLGRKAIGIDLNPEYLVLQRQRIGEAHEQARMPLLEAAGPAYQSADLFPEA